MRLQLRLLLSAMMFFEYAVWGAWTPLIGATMTTRMHATGAQVGAIYGVLWLACIITPFIGGQLVDRLMPGQVFLGLAAIVCTISAWMMSQAQDFSQLMIWMWVWSLAFAPTLAITNSIVFHHLSKEKIEGGVDESHGRYASHYKTVTGIWGALTGLFVGYLVYKGIILYGDWTQSDKVRDTILGTVLVLTAIFPLILNDLRKPKAAQSDEERSFSVIRTAGTIGWIVANMVLTAFLMWKGPAQAGQFVAFEELQLTAVFGAILAIVAFFLPNTPPSKETKDPWAFTKAFSLFRTVPGFAIFVFISFLISTEFQFYYSMSGPFMEANLADGGLGIKHELVAVYKSIAQYAEIICLGLLTPLSLKYLGLKKTLVIGALAWPLRYLIYAMQKPVELVLISNSFHGIGFAFVFITSYIYIDRIAPKDIRASAQSLFMLVTLGFGNWLGTIFSGWLKDHYTTFVPDPSKPGNLIPGAVNWPMVFTIPAVLTILCAVAFWFTFREPRDTAVVETYDLETAQV